ncbi:hypothetical protein UlMin_006681, partial [Ulmus minor]
MAALQYLESLRNAHPDLDEWYNSLAALYHKKLWHQLTLKLNQFIGLAISQLYHNFITDFETKINLLKLAHFAVIVSRQYPEKEVAISYLEGVIEKLRVTREERIEEPILYNKMQIACKKLLDDEKSTLDSMTDIDLSLYANYYWVSSQYYKVCQEFAEFYKSALLYLVYTLVDCILVFSALLRDNIYNFGELLAHLIGSLKLHWMCLEMGLFPQSGQE